MVDKLSHSKTKSSCFLIQLLKRGMNRDRYFNLDDSLSTVCDSLRRVTSLLC